MALYRSHELKDKLVYMKTGGMICQLLYKSTGQCQKSNILSLGLVTIEDF